MIIQNARLIWSATLLIHGIEYISKSFVARPFLIDPHAAWLSANIYCRRISRWLLGLANQPSPAYDVLIGSNRMIDEQLIQQAAGLLHKAAPAGSVVYLFGSHARGNPGPDSDLDFLVVEPELADQHREMVRLRDALRPLRLPVDVVVTSRP
ncbi:MAG TPA: nucleotidyltransferase domain-containing protein, partial [Tepidisphaeraceae bacterium]|nr:nucleotidyltransferase domain-containing protein [Tepidisphaeraceae bacterium]